MQEQIKLPNIGDFKEVEVIEVPVQVGDTIEAEQTLLVLETEKATMDIPAPAGGVLKELYVSLGDKISEGALIALVQTQAQTSAASTDAPAQASNQSSTPASTVKTISCPDIGDFSNVEVIEVLIQEGDSIEEESALISLETEKATMEIPSSDAGVVQKLHVTVGSTLSKGDPICDVRVSGAAAPPVTTSDAPKTTPAPAMSPAVAKQPHQLDAYRDEPASKEVGVYAGPAVRRMARELEINLASVSPTGPKGRVTREDLNAYVKSAIKKGGAGQGLGIDPMPEIDFSKFGEIEVKPLSRINKRSAKNLHRNWVSIPHVTQFDEADITDLEAFRQDNKKVAAENGIKLTPLVFIMKAIVAALRAYPRFNTSLTPDGESLVHKHYYHIGVAVDTPNGLVVPVVQHVDAKSLFQLAKELAELSQLAREGGLKAEHMQGSCFTISSLGGIGGTAFTPIVNAPDVAILGLSRSKRQPQYDDLGQLVPRLMLPMSLSYDHRVIDGAQAARFITFLSDVLSQPKKLILT